MKFSIFKFLNCGEYDMPHTIKIYYCPKWGSSKEVRALMDKRLGELQSIPDLKVETISRPELGPTIEIDGETLKTNYKNYKDLNKDLNKKLGIASK